MKAVLAFVAAAGLSGCVAYPYAYYPYSYPSVYAGGRHLRGGRFGRHKHTQPRRHTSVPAYPYPYSYPYAYSYPYYYNYYPYPYYPYYYPWSFGSGPGFRLVGRRRARPWARALARGQEAVTAAHGG